MTFGSLGSIEEVDASQGLLFSNLVSWNTPEDAGRSLDIV